MVELYPLTEAYEHGLLEVGDGNAVYWEVSGNPHGKPAVVVHGGPGQGCAPGMRRGFDPKRYRIVMFDQRGCGRSTPHASDPSTDMQFNTTLHLIADMELLRRHLGIERWLLSAASWGCTLALAYAQRYPERVTEIVLTAITTGTRAEAEWLYRGVAQFFPVEFAAFQSAVPEAERNGFLPSVYACLMESLDAQVRSEATKAWCAWEDAVVSLEPHAKPKVYSDAPAADLQAFVRICTHYLVHTAWLEEGVLLRNIRRLAGIPGVLIHGRLDMSCPLTYAWELAQAWSGAELIALADSGHQKSASKRAHLLAALNRFALT